MSSADRATTVPTVRRRAVHPGRGPVAVCRSTEPGVKPGSKLRRAGSSPTTPGLDFSTRLRVFQRALRSRMERREALVDILAGEGLTIHLTASVGVATLPDVAASAEELVQAADTAMYQVKDRGKNGILAASTPADN